MNKAYITAHDGFALLEKRRLYPNQLHDVLNEELKAKKILCLSDTTDVLLRGHETRSVAHTLANARLGPGIEITQSDFMDFRYLSKEEAARKSSPQFGAHLPQQEFESRREYAKIDSTTLKKDLGKENFDVILGRNCICACGSDGKLCGGVDISIEAQQQYLQTLMSKNPSLIVLSANTAMFVDDAAGQSLFTLAKKNMLQACSNLNALQDSPYRFELLEQDFSPASMHPEYEKGYLLIAYDTSRINFQPSRDSPENKRQQKRVDTSRTQVAAAALVDQKQAEVKKQTTPIDSSPAPLKPPGKT